MPSWPNLLALPELSQQPSGDFAFVMRRKAARCMLLAILVMAEVKHRAVGCMDCVKILLAAKADPNIVDNEQHAPLILAAALPSPDLLKLIQHKADVNWRSPDSTPACCCGLCVFFLLLIPELCLQS